MTLLADVRTRLRAIYQSIFGHHNDGSTRGLHLVHDEEKSTERQKISELVGEISGLSRGQRNEIRAAGSEIEDLVSRIEQLKAREQRADGECTKWLLKIQRAMYSNGVDRPGTSFSDPKKLLNGHERKDHRGSKDGDEVVEE